MYLGIDIGTSCVKAVLVDRERLRGRRSGERERSIGFAPAPPLVRTGSRRLVGGHQRRGRGRSIPGCVAVRWKSDRPRRADARGDAARQGYAGRCAPRSCGTTGAALPNAPRSRPRCPSSARSPATARCPASLRRSLRGCAQARARRLRCDRYGAACQGLCPPADDGRCRVRHVRQRGHVVDGRRARDWSDTMLAATGLDAIEHADAVTKARQVTGQLRAELAEAWGMARVPVVAGGGDNAAGAVGVGVVRAG